LSFRSVKKVEPVGHLRLSVTFNDGTTGEVVLKESHLHGVFEALRDPQVFSKVSCNRGFVEWPGEVDLAPDAMYEEIRANGTWVLD
jgi:hypothetical protein